MSYVEYLKLGFLLLIILEMPHPFRPITRLDAASLRPGTIDWILAMPFERPQFLEAHRPDRPVQEGMINSRIVAVNAEVHHFVGSAQPLTIKIRRPDPVGLGIVVLIEGPASSPHAVAEERDLICTLDVHGLPIPLNRTALNSCLPRASIIDPAVRSIARFFASVLHTACAHHVGPVETTMTGQIG